jgi:hypothetical protein
MRSALFAVVILAGGCLAPDDQETSAPGVQPCSLLSGPRDVLGNAPSSAGPGPREIRIAKVPDPDAIALWWQEGDHLVVLHLRSAELTSGGELSINPSRALVPNDVAVRIVAGHDEWTQDGFVAAGTDVELVDLDEPEVHGVIAGTWDEAATFGPAGEAWRPSPMDWADEDTMARLRSLRLELAWDNGAGGGADFGIAVGPSTTGGFHYVNGEYQATPGGQRETRDLGPSDFAQLGWSDTTRPQVGPSVSTGAFAATGIPYELTWSATFSPDPDLPQVCETLGDIEAVLYHPEQA